MLRQRRADYFAVLHVLIITGFDWFVSNGIFLPICKDYLLLMFAALPMPGEENVGYMIKPLTQLEYKTSTICDYRLKVVHMQGLTVRPELVEGWAVKPFRLKLVALFL